MPFCFARSWRGRGYIDILLINVTIYGYAQITHFTPSVLPSVSSSCDHRSRSHAHQRSWPLGQIDLQNGGCDNRPCDAWVLVCQFHLGCKRGLLATMEPHCLVLSGWHGPLRRHLSPGAFPFLLESIDTFFKSTNIALCVGGSGRGPYARSGSTTCCRTDFIIRESILTFTNIYVIIYL